MKGFENIIVGLDISKHSTYVLQKAFTLAKKNNSKVSIVHAIDKGWFSELFSPSNFEELKAHAITTIDEQLSHVDTKEVEYEILIEQDNASEFVVKTAKDLDAYLIIIGANEQDHDEVAILGSTAHKIAQNGRIPMIIVKNPCEGDYKNVVAFTDLSEISFKSLVFAKELLNQERIKTVYTYKQIGEIALKYYNEDNNKEKIQKGIKEKENSKFGNFIEKYDLKDTEIFESNLGVNTGLTNYVETNKNDLVVLGSNGVNNPNSFIFGSTTSFLMENLKSDLLIYVPKK
ncbi:MAG: universal stress protein [Campylobacteraceae bacterium]|nr:universal stress protein [Campylobacteraceae bacterium]